MPGQTAQPSRKAKENQLIMGGGHSQNMGSKLDLPPRPSPLISKMTLC